VHVFIEQWSKEMKLDRDDKDSMGLILLVKGHEF
jgi:hypothetical protein